MFYPSLLHFLFWLLTLNLFTMLSFPFLLQWWSIIFFPNFFVLLSFHHYLHNTIKSLLLDRGFKMLCLLKYDLRKTPPLDLITCNPPPQLKELMERCWSFDPIDRPEFTGEHNIHHSLINMLIIHWASKETYHFFRATLTKTQSIKMNHISTQFSYSTPYQAHFKKQTFGWVKKE